MADWSQQTIPAADFAPVGQTEDGHGQAPAFELADPIPPDVVVPVIGNFVPPLGTVLNSQQPISFDVTDNSGQLLRVIVHAVFSDGVVEVVHDGDNFRGYYQIDSTRILIANGYRYTALRFGGWPSSPATFNVFAIDASGNETV